MKFVLLSRHTSGSSVPESEAAQNLEALEKWVSLLKASVVIPIRGGKTVSASHVDAYVGDVGGLLIFEADDIEQAVALARQSPGLKYGFLHDVFPEISLDEAARKK